MSIMKILSFRVFGDIGNDKTKWNNKLNGIRFLQFYLPEM